MIDKDSIVVFDGTSYFVESIDYELELHESIEFKGTFKACSDAADELNDACFDKPRTSFSFGFSK